MREYVRIRKGSHELSVSSKAFESIYREKGFALADSGKSAGSSDGGSSKAASGSKRASKSKAAAKRSSKKKNRVTGSPGETDGAEAAKAEDVTDAG